MRKLMLVTLVALLVATTTGVLLRFGLLWGMPVWAQNYNAVRHAHSHLMYFGWGTLAIMAMIWHMLPRWTSEPPPRAAGWQMGATAVVALLSFPAFWSNGYGLTQISTPNGSVALPLGSIVSGWNGLAWIAFALLYARATTKLKARPLPVQLWDWAIVLLLLACSGAIGLVILVALDHPSLFLHQTMLHLFLELFAAGWFILALLGLLWGWIAQTRALPKQHSQWLPTRSLAVCLAPTFFLGMSPALVPEPTYWISVIANALAALLLAWHLWALWQYRAHLPLLIQFGLAALSLHLLIALLLLWPGIWRWSAGTQLRIFYMHNMLLGGLSSILLGLALGLWFTWVQRWQRLIHITWVGGVGTMLLALLGLGLISVIPPLPANVWLILAAWSSLLILCSVIVVSYTAIRALTSQDKQASSDLPVGYPAK